MAGGITADDCRPCPRGTYGDAEGLASRECSGRCSDLNTAKTKYYGTSEGLVSKSGCRVCPEGYLDVQAQCKKRNYFMRRANHFCLWNNEGHSWGNHFPGMHMTREWMEGVFRRAELRTTDVAGHGGKRTGRITLSSAFAFSTVVLLCATVGAPRLLRMLHCFVGKGRKWKR